MKILDTQSISSLREIAATSSRHRTARTFHDNAADLVQRIVIVSDPDTYVGPHRHPDKKWEMLVLLSGALDVLLFADDGELLDRIALRMNANLLVEYAADAYHAAVILEPGTMVLEIKEGPYDMGTAKELVKWAPAEDSAEAADFNARMLTLKPGQHV